MVLYTWNCLEDLRLNLQGIELESLISLLRHLKIIVPLMDNSYFMPSILPLCDETVVFIEEYGKPASFAAYRKCIVSEVHPLLIEFLWYSFQKTFWNAHSSVASG